MAYATRVTRGQVEEAPRVQLLEEGCDAADTDAAPLVVVLRKDAPAVTLVERSPLHDTQSLNTVCSIRSDLSIP
eukprot:SAG25_NODE_14089_length_259_cov_0.650000_1_plen_73_part_01